MKAQLTITKTDKVSKCAATIHAKKHGGRIAPKSDYMYNQSFM
jgi:hypothetical protein